MDEFVVKKVDMTDHGKAPHPNVHTIIIKVKDIDARASNMVAMLTDTSWLNKLAPVEKATFSATSKRTIVKLVELIKARANDEVTADFGEFMVSDAAQNALQDCLNHSKVPLAELLKEKISGNPGFDFHTESSLNHIAFGEAKYSGVNNPYPAAINQIIEFIALEKDSAELNIIQNFVSQNAIQNSLAGKRAYVAAFSVNGQNPNRILANALECKGMDELLKFPEIFLIGVQIDA